jgi:hypothetical protein
MAYQANGQVKDAVELLEEVVRIKQTLEEDHPSRLVSQLSSRTQAHTKSLTEGAKEAKGSTTIRDISAFTSDSQSNDGGKRVKEQLTLAHHLQLPGEDQRFSAVKQESPWKTYDRGYDLELKMTSRF